jgi:hypothetical protein
LQQQYVNSCKKKAMKQKKRTGKDAKKKEPEFVCG